MRFTFEGIVAIVLLLASMLAAQAWGRRQGERRLLIAGGAEKSPYGATEGAVFALLGLFLAFVFSGAGSRFDSRRQLVIEETNAIGTAWLRIDLLPAESQPRIRGLFRDYLDARIETYRLVSVGEPYEASRERYVSLQREIWDDSVRSADASGKTVASMLLLPALNQMFDISTTRVAVTKIHPPVVVYGMIALLAIVSSVFVGYGIAGSKARSSLHSMAFALVLAIVLYVIVDLEFPRLGLIRVDSMDQLLQELRESMGQSGAPPPAT